MRVELGTRGVGGNKESWHYLERSGDQYFYVKEFDYVSHDLSSKSGTERLPLEDAVRMPFYDKAKMLIESGDI